jgi:hypothetical protein
MAHFAQTQYSIKIDPPPPNVEKITAITGSKALSVSGLNFPVALTGLQSQKQKQPKSVIVMAHFDTGASITSIDRRVAKELDLSPIGIAKMQTASGLEESKRYMLQIAFPNTGLKGYRLDVGDCNLPFNGKFNDISHGNFAVLIGRDIMSKWNIVWNGPTSTVFISD